MLTTEKHPAWMDVHIRLLYAKQIDLPTQQCSVAYVLAVDLRF
jgi:hypothetical protein